MKLTPYESTQIFQALSVAITNKEKIVHLNKSERRLALDAIRQVSGEGVEEIPKSNDSLREEATALIKKLKGESTLEPLP